MVSNRVTHDVDYKGRPIDDEDEFYAPLYYALERVYWAWQPQRRCILHEWDKGQSLFTSGYIKPNSKRCIMCGVYEYDPSR